MPLQSGEKDRISLVISIETLFEWDGCSLDLYFFPLNKHFYFMKSTFYVKFIYE